MLEAHKWPVCFLVLLNPACAGESTEAVSMACAPGPCRGHIITVPWRRYWAGASWSFPWVLVSWTWLPFLGLRMGSHDSPLGLPPLLCSWYLVTAKTLQWQKAQRGGLFCLLLPERRVLKSCITVLARNPMGPDLSTDFPEKGFRVWVMLNLAWVE